MDIIQERGTVGVGGMGILGRYMIVDLLFLVPTKLWVFC